MTTFHPYKDECTEFNHELIRVYRDLDFVEQLGSGMEKILRAYSKDIFRLSENFMELFFTYDSGYLPSGQVRALVDAMNDGKASEKIVVLIQSDASMTIAMLSEYTGITTRSVKRNLKKLQEMNRIRHVGPDKNDHWEIVE